MSGGEIGRTTIFPHHEEMAAMVSGGYIEAGRGHP